MAVTSMWKIKNRLDHVIEYISNIKKTTTLETVLQYDINEKKTVNKQFVTSINCLQDNAYVSMVRTKKLFKDESSILAFHGYQSFSEGEVTPEIAHDIGVELAKQLWGDRFEVIVSTHLNTANIHNHFLINSTSFVDGKRYCNTKHDRRQMMKHSDTLCKNHGLSVIAFNGKKTYKNSKYHLSTKEYKHKIEMDIDVAIKSSVLWNDFIKILKFEGYTFKQVENTISILHSCSTKEISFNELGDEYQIPVIKSRIGSNAINYNINPITYEKYGFNIKPYYDSYKRSKLTGFQRLYLHWQYVLGILPKHANMPKEMSKEMRIEIKKLDSITQETILLCHNDISTMKELDALSDTLTKKMDTNIQLRKHCYYKVRRSRNIEEKKYWQKKAKTYTPSIKELRQQIKYCNNIKNRSLRMQEQLKEIQNEKERKKVNERY